MLNRVLTQGRLVADPELRTVGENTHVCSFRIAVDRDRVNKDTKERTADFFDVTAWRSTCDFVCQWFAKGDPILVDGRLQSRNWTDKEGNKRISVEIAADNVYFGGPKKDGEGTKAKSGSAKKQPPAADVDEDDDFPF